MASVKIYLDISVPNFATSKEKRAMPKTTRESVKEILKGKYRPYSLSAGILSTW